MSEPIKLSNVLSLPQRAVTKKFAIMGISGSGKTYAAGKLVEEMLDQNSQVIVLDPVGVWWGLRLSESGKRRGYDIPVIGGIRGDLPLEHTAGKLVAETLAHGKHSCVVDVSMLSKGKMAQFSADFADAFLDAKKRTKSPVHLVLEEAQLFVPQFVRKGNANGARMLGAFEDLIKVGRNHGVGNSLVSQRPQAVNWDVLSQAEVLMAFQMVGIHERKTIKQWVVENDGSSPEALNQLPSLSIGECFFWSPAWLRTFLRMKINKKKTYDASATPEEDEQFEDTQLPKLDLALFGKQMAALVDEVKESDVSHLKAEVARLHARVKDLQTKAPDVREVEVQVPTIDNVVLDGLEKRLYDLVQTTKSVLDAFKDARKKVPKRKIQSPTQMAPPKIRTEDTAAIQQTRRPIKLDDETGRPAYSVYKGPLMIAAVSAAWAPQRLSRSDICTLAGIPLSSSTASIYPGKAVAQGWVEKEGDAYVVTSQGIQALRDAGGVPVKALPEQVRTMWLKKVNGKQRDIINVLCLEGPMDRVALMERVGIPITSSTSSIYPGKLKRKGLISYMDKTFYANRLLVG
jgi:hypothetical protein